MDIPAATFPSGVQLAAALEELFLFGLQTCTERGCGAVFLPLLARWKRSVMRVSAARMPRWQSARLCSRAGLAFVALDGMGELLQLNLAVGQPFAEGKALLLHLAQADADLGDLVLKTMVLGFAGDGTIETVDFAFAADR